MPNATAECTFYSGNSLQNMTINLPNVVVGRDTPPGTILARSQVPATKGTFPSPDGNDAFAKCTAPGNSYYAVNGSQMVSAGGLQNVFATNVPGIGLRIYMNIPAKGGYSYRFTTPGTNAGPYLGGWGWYMYGASYWGVEVIVTGSPSSGQTDGSVYGTVKLDNLLVTYINIPSFRVTMQACQTPDVTVPLGDHLIKELANTYTSSTSFDISITNCPAGLNTIKYRVDPTTTVINSAQSVVALDSAATASGVGVQLLDGSGNVFPLSTYRTFGGYVPSTGGSYTIPMRARYYRTGTVVPGTANTSMVLNMLYQ